MGHGFGLGHSTTNSGDSCLIMYPYGTTGVTKRVAGDGDLVGIHARYGA